MVLQTEYEFTLPKGYQEGDGELHRSGIMRLATAGDEILPLKDQRGQGTSLDSLVPEQRQEGRIPL